jgi:hypothetical protein
VGSWNAAIFSSGWIALNLFDYPKGQELTITDIFASDRGNTPIHYINEIGIGATNQRIEIFVNSPDQIDLAENVAAKIIETLPHTPLGSYGLNYVFTHENPDSSLLDKFENSEGLDQEFEILQDNFKSALKLDDAVLNLVRAPSENNVVFDFNYHHESIDTGSFRSKITGRYAELLDKSNRILKDHYGLEGFEIDRHEIQQANN